MLKNNCNLNGHCAINVERIKINLNTFWRSYNKTWRKNHFIVYFREYAVLAALRFRWLVGLHLDDIEYIYGIEVGNVYG